MAFTVARDLSTAAQREAFAAEIASALQIPAATVAVDFTVPAAGNQTTVVLVFDTPAAASRALGLDVQERTALGITAAAPNSPSASSSANLTVVAVCAGVGVVLAIAVGVAIGRTCAPQAARRKTVDDDDQPAALGLVSPKGDAYAEMSGPAKA